jgi:multiple sugar transport system substrate-binding protein
MGETRDCALNEELRAAPLSAKRLLALWNALPGVDADDNNAFHAKQIVMDLDGTISTEVAVLSQGKKGDYDVIVTMGLPLSNDGKPVSSEALHTGGVIPRGAKNVEVAKDFLKFLIQPEAVLRELPASL